MYEVTTITPAEIRLALVKEVMEYMKKQEMPYSHDVIIARTELLFKYVIGADQ